MSFKITAEWDWIGVGMDWIGSDWIGLDQIGSTIAALLIFQEHILHPKENNIIIKYLYSKALHTYIPLPVCHKCEMKCNKNLDIRDILIAIAIFSHFSDLCVPLRAFSKKSNIYCDTFNITWTKVRPQLLDHPLQYGEIWVYNLIYSTQIFRLDCCQSFKQFFFFHVSWCKSNLYSCC